jgi:hypothetical protein
LQPIAQNQSSQPPKQTLANARDVLVYGNRKCLSEIVCTSGQVLASIAVPLKVLHVGLNACMSHVGCKGELAADVCNLVVI